MRVLVTGAFGRLGREGIERLVGEGHSVTAFDVPNRRNRKAARQFADRLQIVWGDIRSAADVDAAVADCDAIIHNAGVLAPASELHPDVAYAVNVDGTNNILGAMRRKQETPVIVFASSLAVCGPRVPGGPPLTGDLPAIATDNYTSNKAECERLLRESGLPYVIFRIGVSVGVQSSRRRSLAGRFSHALQHQPRHAPRMDSSEGCRSCAASRDRIVEKRLERHG